jgi:HEPN domain-containing protein
MSEAKRTDPRRWEVALEWLDQADGPLRIADILLSEAPDLPWGAAFHCQQALEKMAKGVLIAKRIEPPKTHDIELLGRLVGSRAAEIGEKISALSGLTVWYIAPRYPDAMVDDIPSQTDLVAAIAKLRELRLQIDKLAPAPGE